MNLSQLQYIMKASQLRCLSYLVPLNDSMAEFGITDLEAQRCYLATIGEESGALQYTTELWGPTADQLGYEPPSRKAAGLGNTNAGDGFLFRGRSLIQITGRRNYAQVSEALGVDYVGDPNRLAQPADAVRASCWWFATNGCIEIARADGFLAVSRRVNLGSAHSASTPNNWASRQAYYTRTQILKPDFGNVVAGVETGP